MSDREKLAIARGFLYSLLFAVESNDIDRLEREFGSEGTYFAGRIKEILDKTASPIEPSE